MIIILFWLSFAVLVYTYFGYPLYIFVKAKASEKRVNKSLGYKPMVSVIFSAHNEEKFIQDKINNLLDSDYPSDKLEILVGSDGSADKTNEILSHISDKRIKTFIFSERRGKVSVLNELAPKAQGEILVFCDTRQMFDSGAIRNLTANFADSKIGCVSGELVFVNDGNNTRVAEGIGVYLRYEQFMRRCESKIHSMVGATGAIYAIRKELYSSPPKNTILDDVYIPLAITRRGYRCIVDTAAKAYDKPSLLPREEYRRKARTHSGNYQIFIMFKDMFMPFKSPVAVPFFSHKLLRVLAPFFMMLMFVCNIFVTGNNIYGTILTIQLVFYSLAVIGSLTYKSSSKKVITKLASVPYMFCQMNFTAFAGFYRFLFSKQSIAWEK